MLKTGANTTVSPISNFTKSSSIRYESTQQLPSMTDEEVDEWLQTIRQARMDILKNGMKRQLVSPDKEITFNLEPTRDSREDDFTPTKEQWEQYQSLKSKPLPHKKDPVLEHVTNMIMRHGKKQVAERIISRALHLVYCQTRSDPVELLKKVLDDMAPLMITKTLGTKVAKASVVPVPLNQRQRNRIAWKWIVEGANKRASSDFAVRLGEELVAVSQGIGSGFEKRDQMHKTAIAHRAYIKLR